MSPALPQPERSRFDSVLAGGGAEAAAGVFGDVEIDAIAVVRVANTEAVRQPRPDHPRDPFGAGGRVHRDEIGVRGLMVQPPHAVVLGEVRMRGVLREQNVQSGCCCIDVAIVQILENLAERPRQGDESGHVSLAEAPRGRGIRGKDLRDGLHLVFGGSERRELVDQLDRSDHSRVKVTI